ncbi:MAG: enoyl-CoA hydratase/isomerase family protein [Candidatus Obscuribacterales bacterium]|nr:enoyl-CoA hydratase/isomerase family protein [Candidatus Obscuribacterales bacterium]
MTATNAKTVYSGNAVHLSLLNNGVALVCFDMKESKVNLLSSPVMAELSNVLDQLAVLPGVRGAVFYSGKENNFIAGADVNEIAAIQRQHKGVAFQATQDGKALLAKIRALPFTTVCAINGTSRGGGAELPLWCTYILMSEDATIGYPEGGLGFLPGFGGNVLVIKRCGFEAGMPFVLMPLKAWDARKAWKAGLIDEVVPKANLLERAVQLVLGAKPKKAKRSILQKSKSWLLERTGLGRKLLKKMTLAGILKETKGNYPAPVSSLDVALKALTLPEADAFTYESQAFAELCVGPVSRNLVRFFLTRQDAKKTPEGVKPDVEVRTVGVLGFGVMGSGITQVVAYSDHYKVVVCESFPQAMERGKTLVKGLFDKLVEKGKLSREEADRRFGNISYTDKLSDLAQCDLVIEAIIEDLAKKQGAFAQLGEGILASNTSFLKVSKIAEAGKRPERVAGLHFFNPAHIMELVEVIAGEQTSAETLAALRIFASKIGKTVVGSQDSPGFIVNRILAPYLFEAIRLFEAGVPAADLDKALVKFGMKMGPLALLDEIGFDIAGHVIQQMNKDFGDRFTAPRLLKFFQESKLLGKKGGKGFYLYDQNGKPQGLNPELLAQQGPASPRKFEEIQDRLALVMVNEAAKVLEEGVAESAEDIDLAMILGTGFAPFRGGVMKYADATGPRVVLQKLEALHQVAGENYLPAALVQEMAASGRDYCRK